jgi:light-regulated signal transduction histidine kinase (bacteriophytochrome)
MKGVYVPQPSLDYQKLFHTMPSRFIIFTTDDPAFTIIEESDEHATFLAMSREDVIGKSAFDVFPDDADHYKQASVNDLLKSFRKVIQTKQPDTMAAFRCSIKAADGTYSERYWQVTHYPLFDGSGNVKLIFQATVDITRERKELQKRRRLENELRQANERLESRVRERTAQLEATNADLTQSNRELEDFAYVASHDLQEPLRKIQTFGNLLESEYAVRLGEGRDYLARMRNAAGRMSALIEDLLSFSRITTKAREFTNVNLQTIAKEVVSDLETHIEETEGEVHIKKLPIIQADPMQMRQLLQNLIGNALKFHKANEAPAVTVSAKLTKATAKNEAHCTISVQDNGIGFDEKYLDRIFSVFQRLHGRDHYEGTGIGLAVCRKIAERHGGSITATSEPGIGSTFLVTLPVQHTQKKELHE